MTRRASANIHNRGFTLVELMIVATVLGVLAALALPAYRVYAIKAKIAEGLGLAQAARNLISTDAGTSIQLANLVDEWNARAENTGANSKFVSSILLSASGEITVTYDAVSVGVDLRENTLTLHPHMRVGAGPIPLAIALAAGQTSPLDWACASNRQEVATAAGFVVTPGTLRAEYAPSNCR
jgi:type IV pilus assembly protein PilA